ncbi:hypothetical protein SAMN05444004_10764 [Jannaschia faecimaris]|uniref:Uncharacterized protein n=1 Tax=Jannaschia faecimaris TaxID=1244108 RepID=A0A1H3QYH5_9RHOB|nr:hypothetical protein [Jannaschia faecimaris]SDZ18141.1 hypothetical protein SAMN05444004_10764 [Jannaschia faecimaris]
MTDDIPGIGHNSGQDFNGYTGRLHQWRKARRALIPNTIPVEVVRMRVRRAAAIGLDYHTYASIRAGTGRDITALLFSSNALGMIRRAEMEAARAAKLAQVAAERGALLHRPIVISSHPNLEFTVEAPLFTESWSQMRARLRAVLRDRGLPADAVLLVGDTAFEESWCAALRAGGYLSAQRYFGTTA